MLRTCAGEYPADMSWAVAITRTVAQFCSAYWPLAVELFCSGALGALLRIARRWVAGQPTGPQDKSLEMFKHGLGYAVMAFAILGPEARAHGVLPLPSSSEHQSASPP